MARSIIAVRALLLLCLLTAAPVARAADDVDRAAGRRAIEGQIEAFRRDDGPAAYGFAAPGIQTLFGSEDRFMAMVRQSYRPVYRPRSYAFADARDAGDGFEQAVTIQDENGVDWDAVYSLEKQPDGTWRISGCRLVKRPGDNV